MSKGPFIQQDIEELEAPFDERRNDVRFLQTLFHELGQRKTQRARDLKTRAVSATGTARKSEPGRKPELVATSPTTAPNTGPVLRLRVNDTTWHLVRSSVRAISCLNPVRKIGRFSISCPMTWRTAR